MPNSHYHRRSRFRNKEENYCYRKHEDFIKLYNETTGVDRKYKMERRNNTYKGCDILT